MTSQPADQPSFRRLLAVFAGLSLLLYLRPPSTNFVFDEQEALLANAYVQGAGSLGDAWTLDFWGLPPERSVGAYRPLPSLLWRLGGASLAWRTPVVLQLLNIAAHAFTATFIARLTGRWLRNGPHGKSSAWTAGLVVCAGAGAAEATLTVVGLADVLAGAFLALAGWWAVHLGGSERRWWPAILIAAATLGGLASKETAVVLVVLGPLTSWLARRAASAARLAPCHRWSWGWVAGAVGVGLLAYAAVRRLAFPPLQPLPESVLSGPGASAISAALGWLGQGSVALDANNNPLLFIPASARWPAVARVFVESWGQLVVPWATVGDYSTPRQPPLVSNAWLVVGALALAAVVALLSYWLLRERHHPSAALGALGLCWMLITYLPVSNALILLPTIRAERLSYAPLLGFALVCAALVSRYGLYASAAGRRWILVFFAFQALQARAHAMHYTDDVAFWRATRAGAPASAKAHLNYGVMVGARGKPLQRIASTQRATELAPRWPLAMYYLGDAYCRAGNVEAALARYERALELSDRRRSLAALALQCLWDSGEFPNHESRIDALAAKHPGSWFAYLVGQLSERHDGLPPEFRPRGYNRGPQQARQQVTTTR